MTEAPLSPLTIEERPEPRRLARVRGGRWFGGVCAGLGRYFELSPTVYRLAFAALALAGGTGILLYLAAWLVMPDEDRETSIAEQALRDHRDRPALAVGVGLLGLAAIVAVSNASIWPHPGSVWLAALLVGGSLVWWELRGRRDVVATTGTAAESVVGEPAAPRRASLFGPAVGLLVAAAGVLGLLSALGVELPDLRIALAAAVILVGAAIAAGAVTGRTIAGLVGLATLLVLALVAALSIHVPLRGDVGTRLVRPAAAADIAAYYRTAICELTVDLRDTSLPDGVTTVKASLGIGDLRVMVPQGVSVDVTTDAQVGDVWVLGRHDEGLNVRRRIREDVQGATKSLVVEAEIGLGEVRIERG